MFKKLCHHYSFLDCQALPLLKINCGAVHHLYVTCWMFVSIFTVLFLIS